MTRVTLHDTFIGNFKISQRFGENPEMYSWIKDKDGNSIKGHNGLDISYGGKNGIQLLNPFPKGNDVVCTRRGYDKGGYGHYCRIWDKTQGAVVLYAHCQEIQISEGQALYFQQQVALGDNTGWSTGPHLHLGFYRVDEKGNKLDRDNGYDGFLNPSDSNKVEWDILNPKEPGKPAVLNELDEKALELLREFKEEENHGNLEGAMRALTDAHKSVSQSKRETARIAEELKTAKTRAIKREDKLKEQITALIEKNANKLSFSNAVRIVVETVIRGIREGGDIKWQ